MPTAIDWSDIALRLFFTLVAGAIIGINRGEHGRPAGLRTTLLVCLSASLAMILANILLVTRGKTSDSFVNIDVMRLPLGILTGIGFIGAGAIVRRDSLVLGVTTAATIWFVTMVGLCFGAGEIALGCVATMLGIFVLTVLKFIESLMHQDIQSTFVITVSGPNPSDEKIHAAFYEEKHDVLQWGVALTEAGMNREITCELQCHQRRDQTAPPAFVAKLSQLPGVVAVRWQPHGAPGAGA